MNILRHLRRPETQGPAKNTPTAKSVISAMVADLTHAVMAEMDRTAVATHLVGDRDRPIGFADIAALPEPEWATQAPAQQFWPGRYTVAALVPAGQLATVPLDKHRKRLDPCGTLDAFRRHLRHDEAPCKACSDAVEPDAGSESDR